MAHLDLAHVGYRLADGRPLLRDISFRVGPGSRTALVGPNGGGKTTLMRLISGELEPSEGVITVGGRVAVMHQSLGRERAALSIRALLETTLQGPMARAARGLRHWERAMAQEASEESQLGYAQAIADWADLGGYQVEALWDLCCASAIGTTLEELESRQAATLSGGEQKRLVLETLLRGEDSILLLDEPDNFLDVPAKRWLEEQLLATTKTVLLISHDREMLSRCAQRLVTLEQGSCWVHGGSFAEYPQARRDRHQRQAEVLDRWHEEHLRLRELVLTLREQARVSQAMAGRYHAAVTRLRHFEAAGPPPSPPKAQAVDIRLRGGRTGVRALTCRGLRLPGLIAPFDLEVFYGERLAVLGANGTGKSRFLELLAQGGVAPQAPPCQRERTEWVGSCRLGARVVPGYFAQAYERLGPPDARPLAAILAEEAHLDNRQIMGALRRYELDAQRERTLDVLSGGQQARFQILLLELLGATMLVLDEPTGNLDMISAQALEDGLLEFQGTVVAVTHDRWFARSFTRFVIFDEDGRVREADSPSWDLVKGRESRR
ncbi:MAG: ATP-binding cassette domain-containing protein [Candidatus Dormibacteraeota bacterium]|nr:ATP-binding cassette domain-containing protein [Candidatus Dormibacteraeota bacterium]